MSETVRETGNHIDDRSDDRSVMDEPVIESDCVSHSCE